MFNGETEKTILSESAKDAIAEIFSSCARATSIDVKEMKSSSNSVAVLSSVTQSDSKSADPAVQGNENTTEETKTPVETTAGSQDSESCGNKESEAESKQTARCSLSEALLTKDQICSLAPGNLLLSFLNAVRHAKESTTELVNQLLRNHGSPFEESDERVLGLEGFVNWLQIRGGQDVRGIWKGVISCGYDLQFSRYAITLTAMLKKAVWV